MLGTSTTPYDLRFRLLDIPVRVHPMFWLITAAMGFQDNNIPMVLVWIGCAFVSILVHEFGHGLAAKHFGASPSIVLWGLGGLCYSGAERTRGQRLAVILAGPGAGFAFSVVVMVVFGLLYGLTAGEQGSVARLLMGIPGDITPLISGIGKLNSEASRNIYMDLIWINLMWSFFNLLPIYPLDGGQATQVILSYFNHRNGIRYSHILSLLLSGMLAIVAYGYAREMYLALLFGFFAYSNYQILQTMHAYSSYGLSSDDEWWKR